MIRELYTSREMHITKDGANLTQYFSCSASDLNNWSDGIRSLPVIGMAWSPDREDLRVSDIRVRWVSNDECRVDVVYSTITPPMPDNIPNTRASIRLTWDFQYTPYYGETFYDVLTGEAKSWPEVYRQTKELDEDAPVPPMVKPGSNITFIEKGNIDNFNWNTVYCLVGRVNDRDFLQQLVQIPGHMYGDIVDVTGDDTGHWLYAGIHIEEVGYRNMEITSTFIFNEEPWNAPYGVTINAYRTANFSLRPIPADTDYQLNYGLR